jgi:hypothetical protein
MTAAAAVAVMASKQPTPRNGRHNDPIGRLRLASLVKPRAIPRICVRPSIRQSLFSARAERDAGKFQPGRGAMLPKPTQRL